MAKKKTAGRKGKAKAETEYKLVDFAQDLGSFLGTARAKAASWMEQRKALADQLVNIRDTASELLRDLGVESSALAAAVRRGYGPGKQAGKKRKRYVMTAEHKAKLAAARKKAAAARAKATT